MNKQQLAAKIWESANRMRSKIEANDYKDYILGFIFYKYLSDKEERWLTAREYKEEDIRQYVNEDDQETVQNAQRDLGYFIAYKDLFSTWISMGSDFSVDNVRTALSSFTRLIYSSHKKVFDGVFNTLETGLSKLGDTTKSQTKAVSDLIQLINDIPMDGKQDYDVLGFIYEYLISQFAANAGKKAGEFYTPHEVSLLMSEIIADHLKDREEIRIYDPTSGSGSLLINIGHAVSKYMDNPNHIRYYAQELKANTYNLTRMNLVMRGILPDNIITRNGDTLEDDWPFFEEDDPVATYDPVYADAVVSNPPYSQRWDPEGKENDPRYSRYGVAPKSKADYAFLLHDLYHLKPNGIMTIVLPHGVLFRGGEEGKIRKNLIENNNIDTIIGLPANIFFGTGIPTIIMVLRQKRDNTDVLIIDASKGFEKEGKNNRLRACDIRKIVDAVSDRKDISKFSRKIEKEEIRQNDYNLNIPRYVDSSDDTESWDINSLMFGGIPEKEIENLSEYWEAFPTLRNDLFLSNGHSASIRNNDIKSVVRNNDDVKSAITGYKNIFSDFSKYLGKMLIDEAEDLSIAKQEDRITANIFTRFDKVKLIDRYEAYELFKTSYEKISGDLEIIQTEGMSAVKQVDPNMVIKKRNSQDEEVQDGWKGHILPFELVQRKCMPEKLDSITKMQNRLQEIPNEYEEILDDIGEEDKQTISDALNDTNDAFAYKNIPAVIKCLRNDDASENSELIAKLNKAVTTNREEKELKSQIKTANEELQAETKQTIEALSDDEVRLLLKGKWIDPICDGILNLPEKMLSDMISKIDALSRKYDETFESIESKIADTEKSLANMMSELTGSDSDMQGIRELQKLLGGDI